MPYEHYKAPPRDVCDFFLATLPGLSEHEEHDQLTLARRLLELFEGPKRDFHVNNLMSHFPWLAQAGAITSRNLYDPVRGGYHLLVRRVESISGLKDALVEAEDIFTGGDYPPTPRAPKQIAATEEPRRKKKKKSGKKKTKKSRKKCCSEQRIVRSKKTGKRRCKNCGQKFKPKPLKE